MSCVKRGGSHSKFQVVQAMKNNQRNGCGGGGNWILHEIILYCLTAFACSLFCYHPYWLPHVCGFIQKLPFLWSCLFSPKCLFLVANAIILFLFGESVFLGSSPSSSSSDPASDYYNQYVERTREARASSSSSPSLSVSNINEMGGLTDEVKEPIITEVAATAADEEKAVVMMKKDVDVHGDDIKEEEKSERDDGDREDDDSAAGTLPAEELNKRVEEFIARVNKQRLLEARSLVVSCRAS